MGGLSTTVLVDGQDTLHLEEPRLWASLSALSPLL